MEQDVAKFEEYPLTPNWWLCIRSEHGEGQWSNFSFIKITAEHGTYKRPITDIMVPRIDGFMCQSHSFPAHVIHQNIKALKEENEKLKFELEFIKQYLNPMDTSFKNMMDAFNELPIDKKDKLIDLCRSLARLSEKEGPK